jgi:hypothetical protein
MMTMKKALSNVMHGLPCAMSWGGFNLYGDEKSIKKATNMLHSSELVPQLYAVIDDLRKELNEAKKANK